MREDDVVPLAIELDHFEAERLPDVLLEVFDVVARSTWDAGTKPRTPTSTSRPPFTRSVTVRLDDLARSPSPARGAPKRPGCRPAASRGGRSLPCPRLS